MTLLIDFVFNVDECMAPPLASAHELRLPLLKISFKHHCYTKHCAGKRSITLNKASTCHEERIGGDLAWIILYSCVQLFIAYTFPPLKIKLHEVT